MSHAHTPQAGYLCSFIDLGGIVGGIAIGFVSDKLGKRGIVSCVAVALAVPVLYFYRVISDGVGTNVPVNVACMLVAGAFVNAPYALITTAVSADLGTHHSLKARVRPAPRMRCSVRPCSALTPPPSARARSGRQGTAGHRDGHHRRHRLSGCSHAGRANRLGVLRLLLERCVHLADWLVRAPPLTARHLSPSHASPPCTPPRSCLVSSLLLIKLAVADVRQMRHERRLIEASSTASPPPPLIRFVSYTTN